MINDGVTVYSSHNSVGFSELVTDCFSFDPVLCVCVCVCVQWELGGSFSGSKAVVM